MITEDTFPYAILADFGLTQEMIEDLPESVLETIYNGGRSPLLPIEVESKHGVISSQARFRVVESFETGEYDVMFYPKLREAPLSEFSEEEQDRLIAGQPVISIKEGCAYMLDKDTNHIFAVPMPVIARNLRILDADFDMSDNDMYRLLSGDTITLTEPDHVTIGINIMSETGITIVDGGKEDWIKEVNKPLPHISYGIEGVWINDNGNLRYVPEENYNDNEYENKYSNENTNTHHEQRNRDNGETKQWSDDLRRVHQPAR